MNVPKDLVKKAIEEAITHCWELLDSNVFDTLAGSMVDRVEAIIKADGWYTKYGLLLCIYIIFYYFFWLMLRWLNVWRLSSPGKLGLHCRCHSAGNFVHHNTVLDSNLAETTPGKRKPIFIL